MSELVTDPTTTVMRISGDAYCKLTNEQREMLRVYSVRSWFEGDMFCFEVASYRVQEILGDTSALLPSA
jgi:hypothetical protein